MFAPVLEAPPASPRKLRGTQSSARGTPSPTGSASSGAEEERKGKGGRGNKVSKREQKALDGAERQAREDGKAAAEAQRVAAVREEKKKALRKTLNHAFHWDRWTAEEIFIGEDAEGQMEHAEIVEELRAERRQKEDQKWAREANARWTDREMKKARGKKRADSGEW